DWQRGAEIRLVAAAAERKTIVLCGQRHTVSRGPCRPIARRAERTRTDSLAHGKLPGNGRIERARSCTRPRTSLAHQGRRAVDPRSTGIFARAVALARPARTQRKSAGL